MKIAQIPFDDLINASAPRFQGETIGGIVNIVVLYIFPIAGLALLLYLLYGGYQYLFSRGEPKGIEQAKSTITNAVIGFVIIFISFWVVQVAASILGVPSIASIFGSP